MEPAKGVEIASKMIMGTLLEPEDVDPVIRKIIAYEETVPGLLSMTMALLLRKRALEIMEAGQ